MNTLYRSTVQAERDHVAKNLTRFCHIGVSNESPKGCLPLGSTGISIPPGRAVRRHGGILPFVLRNSFDFSFACIGPEAEARAELESLLARGCQLVGSAVVDSKGVLTAVLKGVHHVLEDITDQTDAAQKGLLDDPLAVEGLAKLSTELEQERAKTAKLAEELAKLKEAAAKSIPGKPAAK